MRRIVLTLLLLSAWPAMSLASDISGVWRTGEGRNGGHLHVHIRPCGPAYCGTIVHAVDANGVANPQYEHMGRQILWDMVADGAVYSGSLWAPDSNKTYIGRMQPQGRSAKLSGCILGGLICRSQTWQRLR